ncbi:MAG: 5-oxoprolinase subunit PxpA [Sphingomonadales bacterium]
MPSTIDINSDLGEETGVEAAIMPSISSANIACGAHAGNEDTIRSTIQLAKEHQVVVGAHPSYPDRKNFGRVVMPIGLQPLINSVVAQITLVSDIATQEHYTIGHIKLHGALYNEAAKNKILAEALVQTITSLNPLWVLYGPPESELELASFRQGLAYCCEAFVDRSYQDDGSLTPRSDSQALINGEKKCIEQALQLIKRKEVTALSGKLIPLHAATLCIHGDGPQAVLFANALKKQLQVEGISIRAAYGRHH